MKKIFIFIFIIIFSSNLFAEEFLKIQDKFKNLMNERNYNKAYEIKDKYYELGEEYYLKNIEIFTEFVKVLADISNLHFYLGEYSTSIEYQNSILKIYKKFNRDEQIPNVYNNICMINNSLGNFEESILNCEKSISSYEKLYGKNSDTLVEPLINFGVALQNKANYLNSIDYFRRAVNIELGSQKRETLIANIYNNMGVSFAYAANYTEAEKFYLKAIEIREKIYGKDHPQVALVLNSLGMTYTLQNKFELAESTLLRGLNIRIDVYGEENLTTIRSYLNVAAFYGYFNESEKASKIFERVKDPLINQYGLYHPETYKVFVALSSYYSGLGNNFNKSEEYGLQALEIGERILDPLDGYIATNNFILSRLYSNYQKYSLSQKYSLKAAQLENKRNLSIYRLTEEFNTNVENKNALYHIKNLAFLDSINHESFKFDSYEEAFSLVQYSNNLQANNALRKSSARILSKDKTLEGLIKKIQDLELNKKVLRTSILDNYRNYENIEEVQRKNLELENSLQELNDKINEINNLIQKQYPEYFELIQPSSISINETQNLLNKEETLLSYFIDEINDFIFVILISKEKFIVKIIDYEYFELVDDINNVRNSLDTSFFKDFDFESSFKLYNKLISPMRDELINTKQLLIVPSKELFKIPFSLLLTNQHMNTYKDAPWLINDYSIVNLPSITSLKFLKRNTKKGNNKNERFVGFGDPILSNYDSSYYRGIFDNIDQLKSLESLPETRDELENISSILDNNGDLFLGVDATETNFKNYNYENTNLLFFATHGLISGELKGLNEPGLVLTPPDQVTTVDDGILTASEILDFNFPTLDLVVLSACNTSSGTIENPEELSGLTRSFFYSGANSILVSHWPVVSDSAVKLTTQMIKYMKNNKLSNGMALQRSMIDFINNVDEDYEAHPIFWAPFMLVGENR